VSEAQEHQAICAWLDKNRIGYVHSRTDRKHTNQVGDPDFFCFLAGRICAVEVKVGKNKLSPVQEKRISYLRSIGIQVDIAHDCASAIKAVQEAFGVLPATMSHKQAENDSRPIQGGGKAISGASPKLKCAECGSDTHGAPVINQETMPLKSDHGQERPKYWLGKINTKWWVCTGDGGPGGVAAMLRWATGHDLLALKTWDGKTAV
jgi:hypothetical protein